jgi:hypothetical protein
MNFLLIFVIPGLLGGIMTALLLFRWHARYRGATERPLVEPAPSGVFTVIRGPQIQGLINMAQIRVEGVGGLGLVAMAAVVAVDVPRIRLTMAVAVLFGAGLAAALIGLRRTGPLPSANRHPGAHSSWWTTG